MNNPIRILASIAFIILVTFIPLYPNTSAFAQEDKSIEITGKVLIYDEERKPYDAADLRGIKIEVYYNKQKLDWFEFDENGDYYFQSSLPSQQGEVFFILCGETAAELTLKAPKGPELLIDSHTANVTLDRDEYVIDLEFFNISKDELDQWQEQPYNLNSSEPKTPDSTNVTTTNETQGQPTIIAPPFPEVIDEDDSDNVSDTENLTESENLTSEGILPPAPNAGKDQGVPILWPIFYSIVGVFVLAIALTFIYFSFIKPRREEQQIRVYQETSPYVRDNVSSGQIATYRRTIETLTREVDDYKNKLDQAEVALGKYRGRQEKIVELNNQYALLANQIKQLSESLNEPFYAQLAQKPEIENDSSALEEHLSVLQNISHYLQDIEQKHQKLEQECRQYIEIIKSAGINTSVYEKYASESNMNGLAVLKEVLAILSRRMETKQADEKLKQDLETYSAKIAHIRDYTFRVPMVSLLNFAKELIEGSRPTEDMILREKTVKEILNIIDKYINL